MFFGPEHQYSINQYTGLTIYSHFEGAVVVLIAWKLDLQLPMQSVPIITNVAQVQYTVKRSSRTFHFKYSFDINTSYVMYYVMYIKLVDRL